MITRSSSHEPVTEFDDITAPGSERRAWVRLDNASNIFLAARSEADSKVFRISAEVDHPVDAALLQRALDATFDRYPLYHAVLRSGVFWYYLQDSDLRPVAHAEELPTCAPIYRVDRRDLLFRVLHHRRRIVLETFHALSDGTGALWFLSDLLAAYTALRVDAHPTAPESEPDRGLTPDSFAHYFRQERVSDTEPHLEATPQTDRVPQTGQRTPFRRAHRIKGTRNPDNRTRVVELTMPTAAVLTLARAEGVAMTIYLTALFFEAVRGSSPGPRRPLTLAASVPVNLRQFFPSTSPRNFFATIRVEHSYGVAADDLGTICRKLDAQFAPQATPQALEAKLRRFIRFERMVVLRVVPRPLKDVLLKLINWNSNRGLSVAVSNLGRVSLPEPAESQVGRMLFHVSAARPQLCAMSHAGSLTLSFTSPFSETGHVREFTRLLTAAGVEVSVAAARVTETELAEGEP